MTRTIRSPGSTLKPFIYGLAMEQGLVAQETLIEDRPTDFDGYRPRNFDMSYQGDVSVRQALQLSLNVPAVRLLDAVGPARLTARFRQVGVAPQLPLNEPPGLAIGLGGVGVTLRDLVQLYTGLSMAVRCARHDAGRRARGPVASSSMRSRWQIADIPASGPEGARARGIAYRPAPATATATHGHPASTAAMCAGRVDGRPDAAEYRPVGLCLRHSRAVRRLCKLACRGPLRAAPAARSGRSARTCR